MANPLISNHHGKKSKYTRAFLEQNGPGDARPTALDILEDNGRIGTMRDKVSEHCHFWKLERELIMARSFFSLDPLEELALKLVVRSPQLVVKCTWAFVTWRRESKL